MANLPREQDIQNTILQWLRFQKNCFVWRQNAGGTYRQYKGETRFYRQQDVEGVSDIVGVWACRGLAIEVKRYPNKPTEKQRRFLLDFAEAGGIAMVAYDLSDVQNTLKEYVRIDMGRVAGEGVHWNRPKKR